MRYSLFASALVLTPMAHAAGDEKVAWYADPVTGTAFAALVIFLIIAGLMGAYKAVFSGLDARAEGIQAQIDEARALREEASKLMADAKKKAKEADAAADDRVVLRGWTRVGNRSVAASGSAPRYHSRTRHRRRRTWPHGQTRRPAFHA